MDPKPFTIEPARSASDIQAVRGLFDGYTAWLDIDLTFQDYASELANLPGAYSPPHGELLLAKRSPDGEAVGCVALRPLLLPNTDRNSDNDRCCEMKRLYTTPSSRGTGVGRALVAAALDAAGRLGYAECRLDTLPRMEAAMRLYEDAGFVECEAYYETPVEGTRFLRCNLGRREGKRESA